MKRIISFYRGNAHKVSSCCSWLMVSFSSFGFNILNLIKDSFICLNYTLNITGRSFKKQALLGGVLCALFMPGNTFSQQFRGLQTAMAVNVQHKNPLQRDPIKKDYQRFVYDNNQFFKESAYTVSTNALPLAGASTPCTAHRWFAGDGWRNESTPSVWEPVVLAAPSLQPKGIVRCASSAETESQLQVFKGSYVEADNPIAAVLPQTDCFSMNTNPESFGHALSRPTEGEEIVWLNFDIRPLAGTYQFQIVTNENVGFVLFYVDPASAGPISGEDNGTSYPSGLSGDCSDLVFSDIKIAGVSHPACGFSGNGWTTITVPSFTRPTNYYLAMWMADPGATTFPNSMNLVYKSRFGCGGATCTLEHMDTDVVCNGDGTYTACVEYGGSEGRWNIAAPGATSYTWTTYAQDGTTVIASGNSSQVTLGIIPDGAVFAKICAIYPIDTPYDISLTPDPTYRENDTGYIPCADGDRQQGPSPSNPLLTCIDDSLLNSVRCGVSANEAQTGVDDPNTPENEDGTNALFADWFANFAAANQGANPTVNYVYSSLEATPPGGTGAPLNPEVPDGVSSVTVTWTLQNAEGCISTCDAEFRVTRNCLIGCTPTPFSAPCDGTPGGSIHVEGAGGTPPYTFHLYDSTGTVEQSGSPIVSNAEPGVATFTGLAAGSYIIRIEDQVQTIALGTATECDTTVEQIPSVPIVEHCSNDQITACGQTQEAINADYVAWFNSLAPTGGTNLQYTITVRDAQNNIVDQDTEDNDNYVPSLAPNRCGAVYTATVTYSDDCDQSGDCQGTYTVIGDTEDPVIVDIPDYQLQECNEAWPTEVSTTFTDNCGVDESLSGNVDGVLIGEGALNECTQYRDYRFRVVDDCGNDAEQTLRITRHYDETDPIVADIPDYDLGGCNTAWPTEVSTTFTDNCGVDESLSGNVDGVLIGEGNVNACTQYRDYRFRVVDDCGNDAEQTLRITRHYDETDPIVADIPDYDLGGCNTAWPTEVSTTFTDNCGVDESLSGNVDGVLIGEGALNECTQYRDYRFRVVDDCGNDAEQTLRITRHYDETDPIVADIPDYDLGGCNTAWPTEVSTTFTDNCGVDESLSGNVDGVLIGEGNVNACTQYRDYRFRVVDDCGNDAEQTLRITRHYDETDPIVADIPDYDLGGCNTAWPTEVSTTFTDNCGVDESLSGNVDGVLIGEGALNECTQYRDYRFRVVDDCGNDAEQTLRITRHYDETDPIVADIPDYDLGGCNTAWPTEVSTTFTDNCGVDESLSGNVDGVLIGEGNVNACTQYRDYRFRVVDDCGNDAEQTLRITRHYDETDPIVADIPDYDLGGCNTAWPTEVSTTFTDNCGVDESLSGNVDGVLIGEGALNECTQYRDYRFRVVDDCGNDAEQTLRITRHYDETDPIVADIPDYDLGGCNTAWPTEVSTTFTDNCGVDESLSGNVDGVLIGEGTLNECTQYRDYRFRVVDDCGNDAEQTLRITRHYDETDPVIECPDDIVVGVCEEFPTIVTPQATDNCGGEVEVVGTRSDGLTLNDPFPVGQVITVTFTATDGCNNSASCDFTVTVNPCDAPHCTYTQGYYGAYNGSACTPEGVRTTDYEIMRTALGYYTATTTDDQYDFGSVANGNFFRLKLSDISGDPTISKNNIYKMLPGGGTPRALVGFDTYDLIGPYANVNQKWTVDDDPLDNTTQRTRRGRINNNLLSQTMALFFNRSVDGTLGDFEFGTTFATADVECGYNIPDMESIEVYHMPDEVVTYLANNGGATVDNLFALANRVLGGEIIQGITPTAVNSAVDNINNAFDGCRTVVAVPVDSVINDPDVPVDGVISDQSTFTAYPVPFKDNITIRYNFNYQSKARIEVFDAKGMYLMSYDDPDAYYGKEVKLEPTFNTGEGQMFFIKLITDRGVSMKKVISKK